MLDSAERLATRPQSVDDIASSQKHWCEIDGRRELMRTKSRGLIDFISTLGSHAPGAGINVADLSTRINNLEVRWTTFEDQMEAFNEMIAIQKTALKVRLEEHVMEQNQAIDKFAERWRTLRPTELEHWDLDSVNATFDNLHEPQTASQQRLARDR